MSRVLSPVLVGGTGRSGTTMVARLLGSHPDYYMIPIEVRFLVDPGGLCDLVSGDSDFDRFERLITGTWWYRMAPDGQARGLHRVMDEESLTKALRRFALAGDVVEGARTFIAELLDPLASGRQRRQWIEMTPPNVARGNQLLDLVPGAKLIHSLRDGRDVAASVAPLHWGPSDVFSALEWWYERLIEAAEACRGLTEAQLHIVQMEDLVERDRQGTFNRLLDFVGIDPPDVMLEYFETSVVSSRSNIGRWSHDVPPDEHERLNRRYEGLVAALRTAGAPVPTVESARSDGGRWA